MQLFQDVQLLRTKVEIEYFRWALCKYASARNLFLFNLGINVGLRVSDLPPLKVENVRGKTYLVITEQKTKKTKRFLIPRVTRELIESYTRDMSPSAWLFPSQKGNGTFRPHERTEFCRRLRRR